MVSLKPNINGFHWVFEFLILTTTKNNDDTNNGYISIQPHSKKALEVLDSKVGIVYRNYK